MKQIVKLVIGCLIVLFISGCGKQPECPQCSPIVKYVKPVAPEVPSAKIVQCKGESLTVELSKCIINNYYEMKKERDSLKATIEVITR